MWLLAKWAESFVGSDTSAGPTFGFGGGQEQQQHGVHGRHDDDAAVFAATHEAALRRDVDGGCDLKHLPVQNILKMKPRNVTLWHTQCTSMCERFLFSMSSEHHILLLCVCVCVCVCV